MDSVVLEKLDGGWKVTWGDKWEDHLGADEALGVVAVIIFGGETVPRYLRNTEQHAAWDEKYGPKSVREEITGGNNG